jgi:biopolymer transport protein ExbB
MFLAKLFSDGGWVMWPLSATALMLWYFLGYRIFIFQYFKKSMRDSKNNEGLSSDNLDFYFHVKDKNTVSIKSLLVIAPLLGLLGTVSGMIETFDSMAEMQMYSQSGGIAAGISQALLTTQFGLIISAPGLLFSRFIESKIAKIEFDHSLKGGAVK